MVLKKVVLQREGTLSGEYPFTIPAIQSLEELLIHERVTFFVGENGAGKSTLLEGIADVCDFNTAGGGRQNVYEVHKAESALGNYLRLSWLPKLTEGFFLRAESFYQFATHIDQVAAGDRSVLRNYGDQSLLDQSHGESFLSLFSHRFNRKGIYLLDEPEAALSPQRQLTFLRLLYELTTQYSCQFIIATHSPIILGYPDAIIYQFSKKGITEVSYEQTEHYQLTRYFLENRQKVFSELFKE